MSELATTSRRRILVVVAHPDDAEFICGGALSRWYREGHTIHFCLCTDGNHGSSDPEMTPERLVAIRQAEQRAAAAHVGAEVTFLNFVDSELEPTLDLRKAITREIRRFRPHIVLCQDPTLRYVDTYINHPDHRAAGEACLAAVMPSASTRLIFPELLVDNLEPHEVSEVLLMGTNSTDLWVPFEEVDMTSKLMALREHRSQLGDWEPIAMLQEWATSTAERARAAGIECTYAEGFKRIVLRNVDETLTQEAEAMAAEN
ncbi:MAG: PIG-L family deacetylase [Herpetosiphonaceae bacterium]|nr:PIG-L family deacetylase [Herpetosiphonaceae bacterium]